MKTQRIRWRLLLMACMAAASVTAIASGQKSSGGGSPSSGSHGPSTPSVGGGTFRSFSPTPAMGNGNYSYQPSFDPMPNFGYFDLNRTDLPGASTGQRSAERYLAFMHQHMTDDANKLLALAQDLHSSFSQPAKTVPDHLSEQKVKQIEKLAKGLRQQMQMQP